tara:strand:- start:13662 stop:15599 length:1938 start_codon:yes stop_codon:yes gene_type:complete
MKTLNSSDLEGKKPAIEKEIDRLFPGRSIHRVLIVIPPDADKHMFNYSTAKRGRYWNFPPYGPGVLAAHLRNVGIEVDMLNLNDVVLKACQTSESEDYFDFEKEWTAALTEKVSSFSPDLVGISCMFSQSHDSTVTVTNEIRTQFPEIPIALGGVHITNCLVNEGMSASFVKDFRNVNFFFTYEAEIALKRFVDVVNGKMPLDGLSQVCLNLADEQLYFGERYTPGEDDLEVIPAFDIMDVPNSSRHGKIGSFYCHISEDSIVATSLSNRGCRAQCTFCSVRNFNGVGVRSRPVQSVIDELLHLRDTYGVNHIMWLDDDLLRGHDRALKLFNEMVRQKVGITWDATNGVIAASCTDELMAAAAESGCIGLNIGMESGSSEILRNIKKPGAPKTFLRAAEVLRKYEQINARVFLMLGFPGESYRMILDTIELSRAMDLDWYNITILQALPNTPIFDSMVEQGYINVETLKFGDIRYNSGAYGKHRKQAERPDSDQGDLLASDFKDAFNRSDLDEVPEPEELDAIWAYMNYHLNFRPLFFEHRPVKLVQKLQYVKNISDLVAPENAFAMYFQGYLQSQVNGSIDPTLIENLENRLALSPYWSERFRDFNMSPNHLRTKDFPVNQKPTPPVHEALAAANLDPGRVIPS